MARWEAGALALAAVVLAVGLAGLVQASEPSVADRPMEGDTALIEGHEHVLDADGRTLDKDEVTWVTRWEQATVELAGGETRELPTLTRSRPTPDAVDPDPLQAVAEALPALDDEGSSGTDRRPLATFYHYTSTAEPPTGAGFDWLVQDREGEFVKVLRVRSMAHSGCDRVPVATVLGQAPHAAVDRLEACLAQAPGYTVHEVTVDVREVEHERAGEAWSIEATVERTDADGRPSPFSIEAVTSPQLPVPLERTRTWRSYEDGQARTHVETVTLEGWEPGDRPLDPAKALPEPPSVELVGFTEDGPTDHRYPFAYEEARDRAWQDPRVAKYLAEHPDARTTTVRHFDRGADERSTPRPAAAPGTQCRFEAPAEGPLEAPRPVEEGWSFYLSGRGEDMIAYVDQPEESATSGVTGDERVRALSFAADGLGHGLELPRTAPSMPAMRGHLDQAEAFTPPGDPFVAVMTPAHTHGQGPLYGFVGRAGCTLDPGTGAYTYEEGGLLFDRGQGTATYTFEVRANEYGALASSLGSPPTPPEGEDASGPVGLVGLAVVSGSVLAGVGARAGWAFYSRFDGEEVVEHPLRAGLLDAVQARPGARLPELAEALDANRDTLAYHARMLERHELVAQAAVSTGTVLYPRGHPAAPHAATLALSGAEDALTHLVEAPGASVTELADALDVTKGRASELAGALEDSGLVRRKRAGRSLSLAPTSTGRRVARALAER